MTRDKEAARPMAGCCQRRHRFNCVRQCRQVEVDPQANWAESLTQVAEERIYIEGAEQLRRAECYILLAKAAARYFELIRTEKSPLVSAAPLLRVDPLLRFLRCSRSNRLSLETAKLPTGGPVHNRHHE